jgi:flap endonuclease-1
MVTLHHSESAYIRPSFGNVQAPSEAEAQCCAMCKAGLVYGVATDDMDALTFGTPKLIRHLMAPGNNQKLTIDEFDYPTLLQQMNVTPVRTCTYCTAVAALLSVTLLAKQTSRSLAFVL